MAERDFLTRYVGGFIEKILKIFFHQFLANFKKISYRIECENHLSNSKDIGTYLCCIAIEAFFLLKFS